MHLTHDLRQFIAARLGIKNTTPQFLQAGGGSINECYVISADASKYFCKINSLSSFPFFFEKEAEGLLAIGEKEIIRVPSVIEVMHTTEEQILLLEFIKEGVRTNSFWVQFGEKLARLHRQTGNSFGFVSANYMGALPQQNTYMPDWISFFTEQRLRPQITMALDKKLLTAPHVHLFERLFAELPSIFSNDELPSLLHGDLWSGNFLCDEGQEPVLIDPAVYYGSRHMDLAMTTLFGGFDRRFYDAYHYHFPLPHNTKFLWSICNLYPLLIHLNLFGSGYLPEILHVLNRF